MIPNFFRDERFLSYKNSYFNMETQSKFSNKKETKQKRRPTMHRMNKVW